MMTDKNTKTKPNPRPKPKTKQGQIDPRLLEILICPITGGPLTYDRKANELISKKAKLAYAVRDGVPIMLADEARVLDT